ncbi:hypothetical protein Leryth_001463 [Lithospermum erythrorhizon]|nr:hypothetical protein Leryth_001463 [Lithospermum erythrorhizon]
MEEQWETEAILPPLRKMTRLHFYFHDVVDGKHPTAVRIAGPKNAFTTTAIVDDPLTEGPDPSSRIIGRAQGLYAIASEDSASLMMAINLAFMEGKYNGSTVSIFGRNPFLEAEREMPIVGGSGLFRFARGYARAKTVKYVPSTGDAIVEYNVYVLHS